MELDELKQFLKVDGTDLDVVLTGYQAAAEAYLLNTGIAKDYTNALYKTLVTIFCGVLLENPTLLEVKGGIDSIGITFNALVAQLRLSQVTT
ncbi:hypothetical protein SOV_50900 [Sporomusa ovata DSM 2662]|uniref:Phage protein n=1 Tax=Sporomusa ovata TaxID=2378 RepID=A0A0U1L0V4_9FIRM|nr:head-tail connector protein [Sporomusa ovata]EQB27463.1 phage gp6-like head-tail connector protein [Sporomusa ovata DSM 2662]CQR73307.1 hypothetical protein SpAn4DRAFT_2539 [Sporomusa ovata]